MAEYATVQAAGSSIPVIMLREAEQKEWKFRLWNSEIDTSGTKDLEQPAFREFYHVDVSLKKADGDVACR